MTMTVSTGMLKFQPLVEAVIVISHRPEVKRYCSLILNSYLSYRETEKKWFNQLAELEKREKTAK